MSRSKRTTIFFTRLLLILFVYSSFGYLFCFIPAQAIIKYFNQKSIAENKFNDDELVTLIFNIEDLGKNFYNFEWIEDDKEFRFEGKMYDVKNKKVVNDSLYVQCYYDEEENILEELLSLHFDQNKKEKAQNTGSRILLLGLYLEQELISYHGLESQFISRLPIKKNEFLILNNINDVPTPPPRLIV